MPDGENHSFHGTTTGTILESSKGTGGFGYDPIFLSDDLGKSFGEASSIEKQQVSHRARALKKLLEWLKTNEKVFKLMEKDYHNNPFGNAIGASLVLSASLGIFFAYWLKRSDFLAHWLEQNEFLAYWLNSSVNLRYWSTVLGIFFLISFIVSLILVKIRNSRH